MSHNTSTILRVPIRLIRTATAGMHLDHTMRIRAIELDPQLKYLTPR